jgi:hypothetical protein
VAPDGRAVWTAVSPTSLPRVYPAALGGYGSQASSTSVAAFGVSTTSHASSVPPTDDDGVPIVGVAKGDVDAAPASPPPPCGGRGVVAASAGEEGWLPRGGLAAATGGCSGGCVDRAGAAISAPLFFVPSTGMLPCACTRRAPQPRHKHVASAVHTVVDVSTARAPPDCQIAHQPPSTRTQPRVWNVILEHEQLKCVRYHQLLDAHTTTNQVSRSRRWR